MQQMVGDSWQVWPCTAARLIANITAARLVIPSVWVLCPEAGGSAGQQARAAGGGGGPEEAALVPVLAAPTSAPAPARAPARQSVASHRSSA